MPLTPVAKECLQQIIAGDGFVVSERTEEGHRYYANGSRHPLPWGVVRSLILSGHLESNDDGLLQEFPQTYRVKGENHA